MLSLFCVLFAILLRRCSGRIRCCRLCLLLAAAAWAAAACAAAARAAAASAAAWLLPPGLPVYNLAIVEIHRCIILGCDRRIDGCCRFRRSTANAYRASLPLEGLYLLLLNTLRLTSTSFS